LGKVKKFLKTAKNFFKKTFKKKEKNTPKNLIYYKTIAFWLLFWFFSQKYYGEKGFWGQGAVFYQ
jgi:dolichol kinase